MILNSIEDGCSVDGGIIILTRRCKLIDWLLKNSWFWETAAVKKFTISGNCCGFHLTSKHFAIRKFSSPHKCDSDLLDCKIYFQSKLQVTDVVVARKKLFLSLDIWVRWLKIFFQLLTKKIKRQEEDWEKKKKKTWRKPCLFRDGSWL